MSLKHRTSGQRWSASRRSDVGCQGSIERPADAGRRRDSDVEDAARPGIERGIAAPRARMAIALLAHRAGVVFY
jgi:hypothetical protein